MNLETPSAKKIKKELVAHNDVRVYNYFWLNNKNDENVINYLNTENKYTKQVLKKTEDLQKELFGEMKSRN